jgi:adenosylhomocysteinase
MEFNADTIREVLRDEKLLGIFKNVIDKYTRGDIDEEKFKFLKEEIEKMMYKEKIPKKSKSLDLELISNSMRILNYIGNIVNIQPFKGKRAIIVLHFLKDLIPFLECCRKCGLEPSETLLFYKEYLYPHKDVIKDYLKSQGYTIYSLNSIDEVLQSFQDIWQRNDKSIFVLEDGGYIVPKLHTDFHALGEKTIGAVEQTTKGERRDKEIEKNPGLYFPIFSVAGSRLKKTYEPPHIAREVRHSIEELIRRDLSSQPVLVIGYGDIGKEIAKKLKDFMGVTVTDKDPNTLAGAESDGFKTVESVKEGVKNKFLIIGATGETTIGRSEILALDHETYLVSASSDQIEINLKELEALTARKEEIKSNEKRIGTKHIIRGTNNAVNLIADARPINFWYRESMPDEVSDLVMALIFVTTIELAQNYEKMPKEVDSNIVNEIADGYEIAKTFLEYRKR